MNNRTLIDDDVARAEFAADAGLQAEFGDADTYCAYRRAEQAGLVRVLRRQTDLKRIAPRSELEDSSVQATLIGDDVCRGEFAASAALQAEFGDAETYCAYQRAQAAGLVRVLRRQTDPGRMALRNGCERSDEAELLLVL